MRKKDVYEVMDNLRGRVSSEEYIYIFIVNYYLSRRLKTNSLDEILERFEDENIKYTIRSIYEGNNNYLEQFNSIKDFNIDEIIEIIGLLSESIGRRGGGEHTTVKSVIDLSLELLSLEEEDVLLDVGSGIGTTLLEASKTSSISGIEINPDNYMLSCLLLDLFNIPIEKMMHKDVFTYDLSEFNANKVFMNMPMALKMSGKKLEDVLKLKFDRSVFKNHIKSIDSSWVFALDIIENTEYEKFVMLMNGNPLYSDIHQDVRKILIHKGKVEAVIALPSNLLAYTAIPIYLVVFSHNNESIKFVDATNLYSDIKYRHTIEKNILRKL
ncbi:N-6 DNA methylase [Dolosicoccus paucivorans]